LQPNHYVQAARSTVFVFCSDECLGDKQHEDALARWCARRRNLKWLVGVTLFVAACITPHDLPPSLRTSLAMRKPAPPADTGPLPDRSTEWPPSRRA